MPRGGGDGPPMHPKTGDLGKAGDSYPLAVGRHPGPKSSCNPLAPCGALESKARLSVEGTGESCSHFTDGEIGPTV